MNLTGKHILFIGSATGIDEAIKNRLKELGAEYTEDEIRLVRIKFTSELAK